MTAQTMIDLVEAQEDVCLVHLYPSVLPSDYERIDKLIRSVARVLFVADVHLTRRGLVNCKKISYSPQGDWIGDYSDSFSGLRKHAKKSIRRSDRATIVYAVASMSLEERATLKAQLRYWIGRGTWPVHITDTHEEALALARVYFNHNALLAYNGRPVSYDSSDFDNRLEELKKRAISNGLPLDGLCCVGSSPLGVVGLRRPRDIDFVARDARYRVLSSLTFSEHDSQLKHYGLSKEELIDDPLFHFHYHGVKFASLEVLRRMKMARREWPKDYKDLLRVFLFKLKVSLLLRLIKWRYVV